MFVIDIYRSGGSNAEEDKGSAVVITGASSGIGRATALACARRGAAVVLAARREDLLKELASECERLGGRALAVPTDVTDEQAVNELARKAAENFGRLDVWVNNAGVALFARFEEAPMGSTAGCSRRTYSATCTARGPRCSTSASRAAAS